MHNGNKRKMVRTLRALSVPSDFEIETKLIVLNFMGLIPASCPATAAVIEGPTATGDDPPDDDEPPQPNHVCHTLPFLRHALETVEEASSSSTSPCPDSWPIEGNELSTTAVSSPIGAATEGVEQNGSPHLPEVHLSTSSQCIHLRSPTAPLNFANLSSQSTQPPSSPPVTTTSPQPWMLQAPTFCSRLASPRGSTVTPLAERQSSARSSASGHSSRSSTHSVYIDVLVADVESLVRTRALSPLVLPLREEIFHELGEIEPGASAGAAAAAVGGARPVMTPESEVAEMLRTLGDRVQEEFGAELERAVAQLVPQLPAHVGITYDALQTAALGLLEAATPGWTQVALVLLLGQRVSWQMLTHGDRCVGRLAEYTTQFIGDHIADFIISNGGWQSIMELDNDELSSDDQDSRPSSVDSSINRNTGGLSSALGNSGLASGIACRDHQDVDLPASVADSPGGKTQSDSASNSHVDDSGFGDVSQGEPSLANDSAAEKVPLVDDASTPSNASVVPAHTVAEFHESSSQNNYIVCITLCAFIVIGVCIYYQRVVRMC